MTHIDVEDMALLEDEISQLRSENEYLKIAIDGCNHENAELRRRISTLEVEASDAYADGYYDGRWEA